MDVLKKTWKYYKPYKFILLLTLLMSFAVIAMQMINPYLTKLIFDRVINRGEAKLLPKLMIIMAVQTVVRHIIQYIKSYLIETSSQKVVTNIRDDVMKKFMLLSFDFFNKENTGDTMTLMTSDTEAVKGLFSNTIPAVIEMIVSFIFASVMLFSMSFELTICCYLILPMVFFLTRSYSKEMRYQHTNIRSAAANLSMVVQENINGVRIVRAFGREDHEGEKFDRVNGEFKDANINLIKAWSKYNWKLSLGANFPYIVEMLFGGILTIQGRISLGTYVAFGGYINYLMNPINSISAYVSSIQSAMASGDKLFAFLERDITIGNCENPNMLENFRGDIEFKNVCLTYDGNKALKDISFKVPRGKKIGIMGATGSGKTSIVTLLGRFYDCTSGKILIDGIDIRKVDIKSLRRKLAYVMQDVFLFSDSVEGNIAFSKPDASFDDVVNAAKIAEAHEFIEELSEKYDTVVGERGIGLSGGQKQRISIARAILAEAPVVILDDATSSVDMETEHNIQEALKDVTKGKTQIIIAHRISSVKDADEILFLKNGVIAERGTHEELLKKKGLYAEVYNEQYGEKKVTELGEEAVS